ncbi:MAG: Crp/Fnr family transcriptional regulator, partial [Flavobacteriales bacterium]|nr:Crp/Fnr family transcriptional regulator [Flavobacteriales bacterium]
LAEPSLHYLKDEFIFYPEDPSTSVFFISEGRVKLGAYNSEGKEMIKHIFFHNEMFGVMSISNQKMRANYAKSMDDETVVCTIDVFDLKKLMQTNAAFSLGISKIMGDRLVQFQERIESLMFKDTYTRVTDLLKEFAKKQGKLIGDEIMIKHNLTHQDFASLTATTRQTVTSILNDLKKNDLIYMERGKMLIRNLDKLGQTSP